MASERKHILVLGGGVIGLSLALTMQDAGDCDVSLLSTCLPADPSSSATSSAPPPSPAHYASAWAGAHHVSSAVNEREYRWDRETFDVIKKLAGPAGQGEDAEGSLVWVRQTELFANPVTTEAERRAQEVLGMYPNHTQSRELPQSWSAERSAPPFDAAHHFDTLDFDVPRYLPALQRQFVAQGGRLLRAPSSVTSIREAVEICDGDVLGKRRAGWSRVQGVFVATGLGTAELSEMKEDRANHFPVRGQTILVSAPWLELRGDDDDCSGPSRPRWPALSRTNSRGERDLYLIPRSRGHYIVGGTRLVEDDDPRPREETTRKILARALAICPGLVREDKRRAAGGPARVEDVDILAVNVGFRPGRKGGPVLQAAGTDVSARVGGQGEDVQVVLAYGFGGYGYQNSWGAAFDGRDIMREKLGLPVMSHVLERLTSL